MRCSLLIPCFFFGILLQTLGCGGGQPDGDNASPTPNPAFGEQLEDKMWTGWHIYEDNTIKLSFLTELMVFEYRDGMWCGRFSYNIGVPGTYFAYNEYGVWIEVLNVTPANVSEYEAAYFISRAYGEVWESGYLMMWLDAVNDLSVPDPYAIPAMDEGSRDFDAKQTGDLAMLMDPTAVTLGEFLALLSDSNVHATGGTTTSEPSAETLAMVVDMPAYTLPFDQEVFIGGTEDTCGWCMQENDPLAPAERSRP